MAKPVVPFEVHPILHASGARTYVVVEPESREAVVVDPILDGVSEVLRTVSGARASLKFVVETHSHGDHLSGAALLHHKTGAEVVMSAVADSRVVTRKVAEGDRLALGDTALVVRSAPGVAADAIVLQGSGVLFSGDTLLVGTIGVRDAPGSDGTALYDTLQRVFEPLDENTAIHPGHDDMGRSRTTIKAEKRGNRWLREKDRDTFLARFAADPRVVPKTAPEVLAANREGSTTSLPDLPAAPASPAAGAGAAPTPRGPVVTPTGMGAARTGGLVPEGVAQLLLLGGLGCVIGCALGFLVSPLFHLVGGVMGALAVGLGLASRVKRGKKSSPGLYYTGPQPRTPLR